MSVGAADGVSVGAADGVSVGAGSVVLLGEADGEADGDGEGDGVAGVGVGGGGVGGVGVGVRVGVGVGVRPGTGGRLGVGVGAPKMGAVGVGVGVWLDVGVTAGGVVPSGVVGVEESSEDVGVWSVAAGPWPDALVARCEMSVTESSSTSRPAMIEARRQRSNRGARSSRNRIGQGRDSGGPGGSHAIRAPSTDPTFRGASPSRRGRCPSPQPAFSLHPLHYTRLRAWCLVGVWRAETTAPLP